MQQSATEDQLKNEDHVFTKHLSAHFGDRQFRIYSLAGDASARRYYRVLHKDCSWVLMQWEPFDPDNYPFLSVLNHFSRNGIDVPKVEKLWPDQGLILLEDLGDLTLERKFWESQNQELVLPFYKLAIEQLARIHYPASRAKTGCTAFQIEFDQEKLMWELNYTRKYLVKELMQYKMTEASEKELVQALESISTRLANEPKYIAHRDYHSRNIMITMDEVKVIDFQDARMGPVQYDLVSLFKDSYVELENEVVDQLMSYYLDLRRSYKAPEIVQDQFQSVYELQSIQRCFKACGSFASFYATRGDKRYLKYIPGTIRRVIKSLSYFPEYRVLTDIITDSGALDFHPIS